MNFKFPCPHCSQRISATLEDVGARGRCPSCRRDFVVPAPPEPAPQAESGAAPANPKRNPVTPPTATLPAAPARIAVATVPAPEITPVTKPGLAILALVLSIFPAMNLLALGLAIYAVFRSDRQGRAGERGIAVAAVTIASLLFIPVNLVPIAVVPFLPVKHAPKTPAALEKTRLPPRTTPPNH